MPAEGKASPPESDEWKKQYLGNQHLRPAHDQEPFWPKENTEATDIETRKLLTMHGFHPKSCTLRLHAK